VRFLAAVAAAVFTTAAGGTVAGTAAGMTAAAVLENGTMDLVPCGNAVAATTLRAERVSATSALAGGGTHGAAAPLAAGADRAPAPAPGRCAGIATIAGRTSTDGTACRTTVGHRLRRGATRYLGRNRLAGLGSRGREG
jgi:hypothetical protein